MSNDDPIKTDIKNVKRVYNNLNFLYDSWASDERLWDAIWMEYFLYYCLDISEEAGVKQHYFSGFGSRRSLIRNAIARL